jgi:multidrug efflux pump subunit AcrB
MTRLENGPPVGFPVQFRISGEQIPKVRAIAEQVAAEMRKESRATNIQFDWDEPAQRSVSFEIDQKRAGELGLSSQQIANFLAMQLSGFTVTQYRERDKLIGVDLRAPRSERVDPSRLATCPCRPPTARCRWRARPVPQHAGIRRDLGARPPADHHRAGRCAGWRAGHRRHQ